LEKKRVVRDSSFNENAVNSNFTNSISATVFRLGNFTLDTNLEDRIIKDYSNKLSSFSKEYTLETIGIDKTTSQKIYEFDSKLKLNIDYNQISSYARYGSVEDLLKFSVKNIIQKYPYSIYLNNTLSTGIINTITNFSYNEETNISTFRIPTIAINNISNIILNSNDFIKNEENPLKNFNITKNDYVVFDHANPELTYPVIGFTGNSITDSFITLSAEGKVFNLNNTTLSKTFHIKPNDKTFNGFLFDLNDIEKYILSNRISNGFIFKMKVLNIKDGRSFYDRQYVWPISDGYNIDISGNLYIDFVNDLIKLGLSYDQFKTDTIYRFYITESLREFDITNDAKLKKLIRTYGYGFDSFKRLIDGFATLNNLTYKKENSIPDILVKNMARVLGWEVFDLVSEDDLLSKIFSVNTQDPSETLIPSEINIELWRRILVNTKWFFSSKGTRKSLESIFKLIGIPEEFILLKEYVYVADKPLSQAERVDSITVNPAFTGQTRVNPPTYNSSGYPIAVDETSDFYFQVSGNTDSGKTYINRFRENGFNITDKSDNKKSWVYDETYQQRIEENTSYSVNDSRLIINTKEIDFGVDPSKALEFDLYQFNKFNNLPICSKGISVNILYVNTITQSNNLNIFEIPDIPSGEIQVVLNGLVLEINEDYIITGDDNNVVEILVDNFNRFNDIITITYVVDGYTNQVEYNIFIPSISENGETTFTLPFEPLGDIQLVLNGYTLTNNVDFYINPNNRQQIVITANISILTTDIISIMFINEINETNGLKYSDNHLVTSFYSDKLYYNSFQNKYVYISDYTIPNISSLKVILNGVTLNNGSDFILNPSNKKQILFSSNIIINIDDIINVFYIIENSINGDCIDLNIDMNEISFFEYTDKVYKNLINTRNRKIITDNKGGLYPTLSKIFDLYYKNNNNKKNYIDLYSYIRKFDSHFTKFVDQLLPATTILRKSGLIVSNPIFGSQKYKYIRGINDGSEFKGESKLYSCDLFDITGITTTNAVTNTNRGSINLTIVGDNTEIGETEFSLNNTTWDTGILTGGTTQYTFENLLPGNYNVYVRDGIGCLLNETVTVSADCTTFELIDVNYTGLTSTTNLGRIEIIASGDTSIKYSIDGGQKLFNNNIFNNLAAGDYVVYVENSIGCKITGETITIESDCDVTISDFEVITCIADGYESRLNSGTVYNLTTNELFLYLNYEFTPDPYFKKYVRDKIIITETVTNQVVLERWVEFDINKNVGTKEVGLFKIQNVPTYMTFNFVATYLQEPQISCEPFTTPLPAQIFNPITNEPQLVVTSINAASESCIGGGDDEYIGGSVGLNVLAPYNIEFELLITYTNDVGTAIASIFVQVQQGQSFANVLGCDGGLYIPGLMSVDSVCINYVSDTNIDLNGFDC
jgi:hypothetical protein